MNETSSQDLSNSNEATSLCQSLHPKPCSVTTNNNNDNKYANAKPLCPIGGSLIRFDNPDNEFLQPPHVAVEGVEILIMGSMASNQGPTPPRKEDEQITSAVMKVLQGYQWSLVPTTTK